MALRVFFTPSAKLDLSEARDHYRGQSKVLAEGFVECAQFAVSRIASSPGQFAIVYKNVRQCPLKRWHRLPSSDELHLHNPISLNRSRQSI